MITVVRGNPTPEELAAAITATLAAVRGRAAAAREPARADAWGAPTPPRPLPAPGPHAWRTSYWPA
ncbi:Acyl-CoA carboxylase epsilon subunit [Streptomyces zhaozhouensis]|uniref:Acyl-CoA carboxylase epsilon subunit n=1 Tax=Streptomyces zhaozhouensis TaxID=1300267 RepID=A0A286DTZ4_9ACTN|nr:acyl-CoA carboxylase epsilon subunit [Streptomyces zhaozhouensis]SOD62063.1 Acyl-CoA carboxylase epsilon subunit [Streptomyces zhaozhouensis]